MTASGRQLKKPIQVKRPEWAKKKGRAPARPPVAEGQQPSNVVPITGGNNSPSMAPAVAMLRSTTRSMVRQG